jgi:hypothetical protein
LTPIGGRAGGPTPEQAGWEPSPAGGHRLPPQVGRRMRPRRRSSGAWPRPGGRPARVGGCCYFSPCPRRCSRLGGWHSGRTRRGYVTGTSGLSCPAPERHDSVRSRGRGLAVLTHSPRALGPFLAGGARIRHGGTSPRYVRNQGTGVAWNRVLRPTAAVTTDGTAVVTTIGDRIPVGRGALVGLVLTPEFVRVVDVTSADDLRAAAAGSPDRRTCDRDSDSGSGKNSYSEEATVHAAESTGRDSCSQAWGPYMPPRGSPPWRVGGPLGEKRGAGLRGASGSGAVGWASGERRGG